MQASGSPKPPEFELYEHFPLTDNDAITTQTLRAAFDDHFGDQAGEVAPRSASEDFSDLPGAFKIPYSYWGIGGIDAVSYQSAEQAGRIAQDIPVNHSARFAPVIQPTLDTGMQALVVGALALL